MQGLISICIITTQCRHYYIRADSIITINDQQNVPLSAMLSEVKRISLISLTV